MVEEMNELISKIEEWAHARNIISGSQPIDQAMKLFSEFGELADNIGKGRDCRDDIGDIFVVLTVMCAQTENTLSPEKIDLPDVGSQRFVVELGLALNSFAYNCDTGQDVKEDINFSISCLSKIAELSGSNLHKCVQIAYNDIKDRKGIMSNGLFIKEDDPAYADVIAAIENNLTP